jgi:hypothetical protein
VTAVLAASFKQLCRLGERREKLHILSDFCLVTSAKVSLAQDRSGRLYWLSVIATAVGEILTAGSRAPDDAPIAQLLLRGNSR